MSDIKRVGLSGSAERRKDDPLPVNRSSPELSLKRGDHLTVSVERVLGLQSVLINVDGQRIRATTTTPLKEGDKIQVVVEEKTPILLLRPVKESPPLSGSLIASVRKAPPWDVKIGRLFFKLLTESSSKKNVDLLLTLKNSILEEATLSGGGPEGGKRVEEVIKNSGLFLENRLNASSREVNIKNLDLKAALLKEIETYQKGDSPEKGGVLREARALLSAVESFQYINSLNSERGEGLALAIPFYFQGEIQSLKIFLNNRKRGGRESGKEEFQISLMLELGALKKVRADILKKRGEIFVTLYVQEEGIRESVQAGFDSLREKLDELGFQAHTSCFVASESYVDGEIPGKEFISDLSMSINFTI